MESSVYVAVHQLADEVGFHACGIAPAQPLDDFASQLDTWLKLGAHADMHFMEDHRDLRVDPSLLFPGAKSVISLLLAYKPSQSLAQPPLIAQYAYGEDYHERVKKMLFQLLAKIQERHPDFSARPFVDTAPISDKLWAARAGLGWIGRNTLLVNPTYGSYCFIGELVTTFQFDRYDSPIPSQCGTCRRCLDACPNHALVPADNTSQTTQSPNSPRTFLFSPRCTSYNTIENRNPSLPESLNRCGYAFGCDLCQRVCPFNDAAPVSLHISDQRLEELQSLASADESSFRRLTRHSALNRIKFPQWQRNVRNAY